MLKKTITYTDYDGAERIEDFYFHLSKPELIEWGFSETGGMERLLEKITKERDNHRLIELFKDLIVRAYGEKSPDGKRFIKSEELSTAFMQTEAYTELFMEFLENPSSASSFANGLVQQSSGNNVTPLNS